LKQSIWPLIRQKLPHTELHIYGAYPPPKATQLHNEKEGFLVKGWAPDANEVMSKARVCLAPLRFGAGLKGKLVEAMLCQTPSVTTTIGGEGMRGNLPWPGVLVDDPEAFAAAAMKLYSDSEEWKQKCDLAPAILEQRFNKDEVGSRVLKKVEYLLEHLSQQRKKNFIGSMLQHHSMKSTQYMSQWIEAKNA